MKNSPQTSKKLFHFLQKLRYSATLSLHNLEQNHVHITVPTRRDMFAKRSAIILFAVTSYLGWSTQVQAEVSYGGSVSFEQRYFLEDPLYLGQTNSQASIAMSPEFETFVGDGMLTFKPFARLDQRDDERTHADIREFMYAHYFDNWEVRAGIGKVFWGQTESLHLVDIINQTDLVESIDFEDKLGQPMLDVRYLLDTGAISFYVLPYFRERTFPGMDGRLRAPLPVDVDRAFFESEDEESNLDYAVRWQQTLGNLELGLSYFDGTNRLPQMALITDERDAAVLVPIYNQLKQYSIDALYVYNSLLLKLEALQGEELEQEFAAYVAGFEYTMVDAFNSGYDLGLLMEHQYDEREGQAFIFGQNDLMVGARLQFNDFAGSEILFGFIQDLDDSGSYSAVLEGSKRLNQNWRMEVNGYFFSSDEINNASYTIRRDDHIGITLEYFF